MLKVRFEGKTFPLVSIPDSTVEELMAEIRDTAGILPSRQEISYGFPVQKLPTDSRSLSKTLRELGIVRRELLTVTYRNAAQNEAPIHMKSSLTEAIKHKIPGDNSCLFNAISYLCTGSSNRAPELRQVVITEIRQHSDIYTPAMLGCSVDEYCKWISHPDHWGGYIEMQILSKHFQVEICVLHIEDCKIVPVNSCSADHRIFILYDNIHYDAVVFRGFGIEEKRKVKVTNEVAPRLALEMAGILQKAGAYTNQQTALMKCDMCGKICQGRGEAERHGKTTGHCCFSQVDM